MTQIRVSINNQQSLFDIDETRITAAVRCVLEARDVGTAEVSVAIVDDAQIHVLNREHLNHDYPTDVLSFLYEAAERSIDGELVVSTETALRVGAEHGMTGHDELLLYVVHGALHLVGYDDHTDEEQFEMRKHEQRHMRQLGIDLPDEVLPRRPETEL